MVKIWNRRKEKKLCTNESSINALYKRLSPICWLCLS